MKLDWSFRAASSRGVGFQQPEVFGLVQQRRSGRVIEQSGVPLPSLVAQLRAILLHTPLLSLLHTAAISYSCANRRNRIYLRERQMSVVLTCGSVNA